MRRSLSIIPLLVALAILLSVVPVSARTPIALGISDPKGDIDNVLAAAHGTRPALWSLWSDWGSRGGGDNKGDCQPNVGTCAFPTDDVRKLHAKGIDPVIWWQPVNPANMSNGWYPRYAAIVNGRHDKYIKEWARDARAASKAAGGRPIVVRFAHEATGHWFPWGIGKFDNTHRNYKQAWKHIHKLFKSVGARKYVRFMWSTVNPYGRAYPGDTYVDYVGITILNFGADKTWRSMASMVDKRVKHALRFTRKPIILAEVASHFEGGNKARWIKNGYLKTYKSHPKVKAIMYLDTDEPHLVADHPDWRLVRPSDGSALDAYKAIASRPKFQGHIK